MKADDIVPQNQSACHLFYCDIANFGDQLNLSLKEHYGLAVTPASMVDSHSVEGPGLFVLGSILDWASDFFRGFIVGTGLMSEKARKAFYYAKVKAVRGRLTQKRILSHGALPLFDPGILISKLFPASEKRFCLGLVPHYIDQSNPGILALEKKHPDQVLMIDVTRSPEDVAKSISMCEHIASSSLHGLITAHSYGIPSVWMKLGALGGGEFKFHDYMSAYSLGAAPFRGGGGLDELLKQCSPAPRGIAGKISLADSVFQEVAAAFQSDSCLSPGGERFQYWWRRIRRKTALRTRSFEEGHR